MIVVYSCFLFPRSVIEPAKNVNPSGGSDEKGCRSVRKPLTPSTFLKPAFPTLAFLARHALRTLNRVSRGESL